MGTRRGALSRRTTLDVARLDRRALARRRRRDLWDDVRNRVDSAWEAVRLGRAGGGFRTSARADRIPAEVEVKRLAIAILLLAPQEGPPVRVAWGAVSTVDPALAIAPAD